MSGGYGVESACVGYGCVGWRMCVKSVQVEETCIGVSAGKVRWRLHFFGTLGLFDSNTSCNNIPLVTKQMVCVQLLHRQHHRTRYKATSLLLPR